MWHPGNKLYPILLLLSYTTSVYPILLLLSYTTSVLLIDQCLYYCFTERAAWWEIRFGTVAAATKGPLARKWTMVGEGGVDSVTPQW